MLLIMLITLGVKREIRNYSSLIAVMLKYPLVKNRSQCMNSVVFMRIQSNGGGGWGILQLPNVFSGVFKWNKCKIWENESVSTFAVHRPRRLLKEAPETWGIHLKMKQQLALDAFSPIEELGWQIPASLGHPMPEPGLPQGGNVAGSLLLSLFGWEPSGGSCPIS